MSEVIQVDCLDVMSALADKSVDASITVSVVVSIVFLVLVKVVMFYLITRKK
jgi:hypothetical protein